jgi:rod shape-determining protein MreC
LLVVCILLALILKASSDSVREGLASVLRGTVLSPLFAMQATTEKWRAALSSYDDLVASRDSALLIALDLPAVEAENERLTRLMLLGSRLKWGFIPARVLDDASPGKHTAVVITAGSEQGVKVLAPVISADGLVGVVRTVDKNTSVVTLWTDHDFSVGAMTADSGAFGIAVALIIAGGSCYMLELRNVHDRQQILGGTRVVAAGVGGVFPAMIPIGVIVDTLPAGNGWSRSYLIRPAVKPQDISNVLVLDPERAAQGVRNVWPSRAQMDSSARAIAEKGDSLGLFRYQAELKAQSDSALKRLRSTGLPIDTSSAARAAVPPPPGERTP